MFEFNGKVRMYSDLKQGTSQNGTPWQNMDVVFDFNWRTSKDGMQYNDSICITVWNAEQIKQLQNFPQGTMIHVVFASSVRMYNNKAYNDFKMIKCEPVLLTQQPQAPQPVYPQQMPMQQPMYAQVPVMSQTSAQQMPYQSPQQPMQGGFVAPKGTITASQPQPNMAQADNGTETGIPF